MTKERNSVRYKAISLVYKFIVKITEKKLLVNVMLYFNDNQCQVNDYTYSRLVAEREDFIKNITILNRNQILM